MAPLANVTYVIKVGSTSLNSSEMIRVYLGHIVLIFDLPSHHCPIISIWKLLQIQCHISVPQYFHPIWDVKSTKNRSFSLSTATTGYFHPIWDHKSTTDGCFLLSHCRRWIFSPYLTVKSEIVKISDSKSPFKTI